MNFNHLQCPIGEDGFSPYRQQMQGSLVPGPPQNCDLPEAQLELETLENDMRSLLGNVSPENILREAGLRFDSNFLESVAASSFDGDQDADQSTYFGSILEVQGGHGCHGSSTEILSFVVSETPPVNDQSSNIKPGSCLSISQNSWPTYQTPEDYPLAPSPSHFEEGQSSANETPWHCNESVSNTFSALPCPFGSTGTSSNVENASLNSASHTTYSCNNVPLSEGIPGHLYGVPLRADITYPPRGIFVDDLAPEQNRNRRLGQHSLAPEQNSNRRLGQHRGRRVYHLIGEMKKLHEKQLAIIRANEHAKREKEKTQRAKTALREQEERNRELSLRYQSLKKMTRKMESLFNHNKHTLPMANSSGVTQACCFISKRSPEKCACNKLNF